jgi:hypothetical protein
MDQLVEAFAENNMEICIQGQDTRETLVFLSGGECFVAWCTGGTFNLDRVLPEGYETIEKEAGILDVVRAVEQFKAPLAREQVCSDVSTMLSFFGAREINSSELIEANDTNWGYGEAFWGFEFTLGERVFRIVFHFDTQSYSLFELVTLWAGSQEDESELLAHHERKDLMEIEEWIYGEFM